MYKILILFEYEIVFPTLTFIQKIIHCRRKEKKKERYNKGRHDIERDQ